MASLLLINYDLILKGDSTITYVTTFGVCLSLIYTCIVFSYLGPFRDETQPIYKKDWRRYFIMSYALINITLNLFSIAYDPKVHKMFIVATFVLIICCIKGDDDSDHIDDKSNGRIFIWSYSLASVVIIIGMLIWIFYKKNKSVK
jgi:hypothetical protein